MQSKQKPPKKSKIRLFLQKITEQVKSFLKLIPIKKVLLGLIGLTVILVVVLSFSKLVLSINIMMQEIYC